MPIVQSIEGCMEAAIGVAGLEPSAFQGCLAKLDGALGELRTHYERGTLPLLGIPEQTDDIDEADNALARLNEGAKKLIFFGTGGSSLG